MQDIKRFTELFPIQVEDYNIQVLSFEDLDKYINNMRQYYYNEHLDFNFAKDTTKKAIRERLYGLIKSYKMNIDLDSELRVVCKNKHGKLVYGASIYKNDNHIEIAYFTVPKYQRLGIAYKMTKAIIEKINTNYTDFIYFKSVVQDSNEASIRLLHKLRFKKDSIVKGKYTNNIIFKLGRNQV